jgi:hypothetical protein
LAQLDLTNVEKAFAEIGVPIKDVNGDFRTLYDVMEDASAKMAYLSEESKEQFNQLNHIMFGNYQEVFK